jgi:3-hydroxyisobutyrate dehydrogenase-like beta-hydroxyacid dehydrogenase
MNVGFIGLGHMGAGIAANLLRAGHCVTVYNRTPAKAEALVAQGATRASRIADACRGEAVITMLADDDAVADVVLGEGGVVESLPVGALHVSSSTISISMSERLATAHAKAGQRFVAAPVFGRPDMAAAGRLFIAAGGEPAAVAAAAPLFDAIGQKTFIVSETPKAANLVKLSGNFLIAAAIEARRQRRRRATSVCRHADVDSVRRSDLQDLQRIDRRRKIRACRLFGTARRERHPARVGGRRGAACAPAACQPCP